MSLNLTINKIPLKAGVILPPTVTIYYKEYYAPSFTLVEANVNIDLDGNVLDSPMPVFVIDPALKYVIKVVNDMCGIEYEQAVIINPYCPVNFELSDDLSYCVYEDVVPATPPTNPQLAVAVPDVHYSTCGSLVYDPGYALNGNGSFTQINPAVTFWRNGPVCIANGNTSDGPLNRNAVWTATSVDDQIVGFSICITVAVTKTYYIGTGFDNYGIIRINGNDVLISDNSTTENVLRYWKIYPVTLLAGTSVIEVIGRNDIFGPVNPAAIGVEIYDNTAAELLASTGYGTLNLVFASSDYVGQPVQIGSGGFGYSCPPGYSLTYCESPVVCTKILITPILY